MLEDTVSNLFDAAQSVIESLLSVNVVMVFLIALVAAYVLSQLFEIFIKNIARMVGHYGDTAKRPEQALRLRRAETYLSVSIAAGKFIIFAISLAAAWQLTSPQAAPLAIIGASTVFIIFAGATLVPTLRDITTGSLMIIEQWYNVGDYIRLEPFSDVAGVVEHMTLRATKIRSLNGEVIWVHNQFIQGVRMTPHGVRTLAIDVFVNDLESGRKLMKEVASTLPVRPTMLASPLTIVDTDELSEKLWHIEAVCQTAPGREWLVEDFAVKAIKERDEKSDKHIILYGPIVRNADSAAEKRFMRAVRVKKADNPQEISIT
jgi:small conductance mechanosensitive channel